MSSAAVKSGVHLHSFCLQHGENALHQAAHSTGGHIDTICYLASRMATSTTTSTTWPCVRFPAVAHILQVVKTPEDHLSRRHSGAEEEALVAGSVPQRCQAYPKTCYSRQNLWKMLELFINENSEDNPLLMELIHWAAQSDHNWPLHFIDVFNLDYSACDNGVFVWSMHAL